MYLLQTFKKNQTQLPVDTCIPKKNIVKKCLTLAVSHFK